MQPNKIELSRTLTGWVGKHSGPHAKLIEELWHTDTIPTAFTVHADPTTVLRNIQALNPDCIVSLKHGRG